MFTIADLMSAVASHLVGDRDLELIFREPAYRRADGCFYKSASGKPIIEIKPFYHSDDRSLFVLLHECAHAKLHHDDIVSIDVRSKPSGSMEYSASDVIPKNESEADALANKWLEYARIHAKREQGMSELEALLWPLLDY